MSRQFRLSRQLDTIKTKTMVMLQIVKTTQPGSKVILKMSLFDFEGEEKIVSLKNLKILKVLTESKTKL